MDNADNINLEELSLNKVIFSDLRLEVQQKILSRNIIFQGENTSLKDLLTPLRYVDFDEIIDSELLSRLSKNEKISVGMPMNIYNTDNYIHRKFICFHEESLEEELCVYEDECPPSVVTLWACPGSGKSTILETLAVFMKNRYPHLWVIKINLKDYSEAFREFKKFKFVTLLDLLNSRPESRIESRFEREIFSIRRKVGLIIDGLDEVCSEYSEIVESVIEDYEKNRSFAKVFVASSKNVDKNLKSVLWLRTNVIDLSDEDRVKLLKGFLEQGEKHCNFNAEVLIKQKWFGDHGNKLIGVPLQLKMLATVLNENLKKLDWDDYHKFLTFYNKSSQAEEIDLTKLYLLFIHQSCFKNETPLDENMMSEDIERINKESHFYLYKIALENVLSKNHCKLFGRYGNATEEINEEVEMKFVTMGIVKKIHDNLHFCHRTIEEYFVALCISNELQNTPSEEFLIFFIEEILTKKEFRVIRLFLNNTITSDSIPRTVHLDIGRVLSSNATILPRLLKKGETNIFSLLLKCLESFNTDLHLDFIRLDGKTLLQVAISIGRFDLIELLVEKGASVNSRDDSDHTALHDAVSKHNLEAVKFLVEHGAEINCRTLNGRTPLHKASVLSRLDVVEYLLTQGADVETKDRNGCTCLHDAAKSGQLDNVRYLVENGANIDGNAKMGTPIFDAVRKLHVEIVEYFLEKGAGLGFKNELQQNALHALQISSEDQTDRDREKAVRIFKLLIKNGAKVNDVNYRGDTVLNFYISQNSDYIIKFLLDNGVDVDIPNKNGFFPLDIALRRGAYNIVKYLTERGATRYCLNSLSLAVGTGNLDIIKHLVEKDLTPNVKTYHTYLMLWRSIRDNNVAMIKYLIENGADVNEEDEDLFGTTILEAAICYCWTDVVEFLIDRGAVSEYAINAAARKGDIALVKFLEAKGFAGEILDVGGNLELLKYLLEKGYNVCMSFILYEAALKGDLNVVKYVLDQGTYINTGNRTALHRAAKRDQIHIAKFLIKRGARLDIKDGKDETALDKALRHRNVDMAAFLLKQNSDTSGVVDELFKKVTQGGEFKFGRLKFVLEHGAKVDMSDRSVQFLFADCLNSSFSLAERLVERNVGQYRTVVDLVNYFVRIEDDDLLNRIFDWWDTIRCLLESEAQIGLREMERYNFLIVAASKDDLKFVKRLVAKGVQVNCKDEEGYTALHKATSFSVIEYLVQNGADVNAETDNGISVLHHAVEHKNYDICRFLIDKGANVNGTDKTGRTVLYTAATKGTFTKFKYLVSREAKLNAEENDVVLRDVIRLNDLDLIRVLVEIGARIEGKDFDGRTALYKAVETNDTDILRYLVDSGGDVMVEDKASVTLLRHAMDKGHPDVVRYLEGLVGKGFKENLGEET